MVRDGGGEGIGADGSRRALHPHVGGLARKQLLHGALHGIAFLGGPEPRPVFLPMLLSSTSSSVVDGCPRIGRFVDAFIRRTVLSDP